MLWVLKVSEKTPSILDLFGQQFKLMQVGLLSDNPLKWLLEGGFIVQILLPPSRNDCPL